MDLALVSVYYIVERLSIAVVSEASGGDGRVGDHRQALATIPSFYRG